MKRQNILLILICLMLIGAVLRLWQLGSLPVILNRDEAALGYNALLLRATGQDEWQQTWPLALQSFGDYKLLGYPLLIIATSFLFGFNDFVVRLPSALAGMLLIGLSYFWVVRVLQLQRRTGLLVAGLVTVEPIFFFFSRMGFEANAALSYFVASLLLLFWPYGKRWWVRDGAAVALVTLALITYNAPLLLLPGTVLLLIWWRGWKNWKRWLPVSFALSLVMLGSGFVFMKLTEQKQGITIFSDEQTWQDSVDYHNQFTGIDQKLLGNRFVFFSRVIVQNYVDSFSPVFLVLRGGAHPWHALPNFAHMGWTVYFLGMFGLTATGVQCLQLLFKKEWSKRTRVLWAPRRIYGLLLGLLLLSLFPAAITVDAPHATRSLLFFLIYFCWSAIGLEWLVWFGRHFFSKSKISKILIIIFLCLITLESNWYFWNYFTKYPQQSREILHGGYDSAITEVVQLWGDQPTAIIDDGGYLYILSAWYLKMSPDQFLTTIVRHLPDQIGFRYGYKLQNFRFVKAVTDRTPEEIRYLIWDQDKVQWQLKETP